MSASALCGREGPLLSVSISVDPRHLESLLEALAQLTFPINPQIYHDAALVYHFPDDHEETEGTTLVEFPAYEAQLGDVRGALGRVRFRSEDGARHRNAGRDSRGASGGGGAGGSAYVSRYRVKRPARLYGCSAAAGCLCAADEFAVPA